MRWIHEHPYWTFLAGIPLFALVLSAFGGRMAYRLNSFLRKGDFWLHRTFGGRVQHILAVPGYSPIILVLTFYSLTIVAVGPTRSVPSGILLIVGLLLLVLGYIAARKHQLYAFSAIAIFLLAAAVFWLAGPDARESDETIYRHVFLYVIPCVVIITALAYGLARWLLVDFKAQYHAYWQTAPQLIQRVELHVIPVEPQFTLWRVIRSGLNAPAHNPFMFVFPIAVAVLLVPYQAMEWAAIISAWVAWCVLTLAGIHERLNNALDWLKQSFLRGVTFVASMMVIALAACRWVDFSYVAIILNSTGVVTILWFLTAVYVTLWFYDYWIGYFLCERMLALLDPIADVTWRDRVPYGVDLALIPQEDHTAIRPDGRVAQIHETRLVVVGQYLNQRTKTLKDGWEFYDRMGLFTALVHRTRGVSQVVNNQFGLGDLQQRLSVYYAVLNLLLVAVIVVAGSVHRLSQPVPELVADKSAAGTFSLQRRLYEDGKGGKPKRAIVMAASGGGTRAALYTTSIFQGLAELGALQDIVLYSGVSGGSASIADLVLHYDELAGGYDAEAWQLHAEVMSKPFVDDVLRAMSELRVIRGTRMGSLLAESFDRRICHDMLAGSKKKYLQAISKVGIIFNTTLAGTSRWDQKGGTWLPAEPRAAGSRLIVTNLRGEGIFPTQGFAGIESEYLSYVVVRDPAAQVTTGAALSANFPPAFSNAAVELSANGEAEERHWITDGGASDNRGAISMLYALISALEEEVHGARRTPPPFHIIIADASAFSLDFEQDRGIGPTVDAAEKYANQLMVELLQKIRSLFSDLGADPATVHAYFLPMPLALRTRGGVHTHWMLPRYVTLTDPDDRKVTMTISGSMARQIIMDLHHPTGLHPAPPNLSPDDARTLEKAWNMIGREKPTGSYKTHHQAWQALANALK
jgi:hypothetical protein